MSNSIPRRQFIKLSGGFAIGAAAATSAPLIELLAANAQGASGYKIVGYFENWSQYRPGGGMFLPEKIDPSLFTHINFAFGIFGFVTKGFKNPGLTGDYKVQPIEWNDQTALYPGIQKLKQKNPNLKTLLSIGGWGFNDPQDPTDIGTYTYNLFSKMAASAAGRQQFISSAIEYAKKWGFNGIDLDWEYPGYSGRGGRPEDLQNFLALAREFRSAISGKNLLLTMASPAIVPSGVPAQYHSNPGSYFQWLAQCAQYFDWLNLMSYDYHGAFPDDKVTGVNAPLPQDSTPGGPFSIKNTVEAYLAAGIPTSKMVLGMSTYGRSFKVSSALTSTDNGPGKPYSSAGPAGPATGIPGVLAYYEIQNRISGGSLTRGWHQPTLTPYAYSGQTGEWVSYDDTESLGYKTSYLIEKGLAGSMIWAIGLDQFQNGYPLIKRTKSILDNPASRPKLPPSLAEKPIPVGPHSWMDKLPNNTKISRLSIPGTHETCALHGGPAVACQNRVLKEQLEAGIRFIDIRCRHIDDEFAIHHGHYYQKINFDDVNRICIDFLKANPSEFIVMSVKSECQKDWTWLGNDWDPTQCYNKNNSRTFEATFDSYVRGREKFWYLGNTVPNLGDVRGKIVLLRRFGAKHTPKGINASPWQDNATFQILRQGQPIMRIQDEYKVTITDAPPSGHITHNSKWERIKSLLDQAKSDPSDTWYINFTSGASPFGYPNAVAHRINRRVYNYIGPSPKFPNRLGSILMDFPDDNIIRRIIALNK